MYRTVADFVELLKDINDMEKENLLSALNELNILDNEIDNDELAEANEAIHDLEQELRDSESRIDTLKDVMRNAIESLTKEL